MRTAREGGSGVAAPIGGHVADGDVELETTPATHGGRIRGLVRRLAAGLVGAVVLNLAHEVGRRVRKDAPRVDKVGERALTSMIRATGGRAPRGRTLRRWTLAGDIVANAVYYATSIPGGSSRPFRRALVSGALAGVGAVRLPPRLGLGRVPRTRRRSGRLMAIAWYTLGGLATAACYRLFGGGKKNHRALAAAS
jgi:hypothetical protein